MDRLGWALALLACLPAAVPVLLPGWFEGHDDLHIYRLIEYDLALRDGQIPPRWFPDVSAGYGNPHPIYYAPLFYLAAEAFHVIGLGVILSLKCAILIFLAAASLSMFTYVRLFWGPAAALVAAAAYTYAPYHLLDLYVRKAFSEFTVFAFLPALLLAFYNLRSRGSRWDIIAGALAMAAMSTSHTITTMMVPPLLGAYALFLSAGRGSPSGRTEWRWIGSAAISVAIGYAIAGFFLVPAFLERNEINLKIYTEAYVDYQKHFVYPQQLLWWPWGFGMSLAGLKDQMSFRMGVLQIAGTLMALLGAAGLRKRGAAPAAHAVFYLGVTAVAIFMMLPISSPVWAALPPLKFVQFPWRFLTLTTLSTAFLCGAAFGAFAPKPAARASVPSRSRIWTAALILCAAFAAAAALGGMLGVNLRVPAERVGFEEKPYNNMMDRGPEAAATPEMMDGAFVRRHTLRWIDHLPPDVSFMGLDRSDLERPKVELESGSARLSDLLVRTSSVQFHVEAETASRIRVNIYRFPGWRVRIDGRSVPPVEAPRQRRVIIFDVTPGPHDVAVIFEKTFARRLGDWMTLAGLAALAATGLWPAKKDPVMEKRA